MIESEWGQDKADLLETVSKSGSRGRDLKCF